MMKQGKLETKLIKYLDQLVDNQCGFWPMKDNKKDTQLRHVFSIPSSSYENLNRCVALFSGNYQAQIMKPTSKMLEKL